MTEGVSKVRRLLNGVPGLRRPLVIPNLAYYQIDMLLMYTRPNKSVVNLH